MLQFAAHVNQYVFLQYALAASLLASVACGIVGSYVVVRRRTYIAGAISHCLLGGMGAARYLQTVHGVQWLTPLLGATLAALIAAALISIITHYGRQREDTVLSAVWAIGMAIGISFISCTPGYNEDLMSYLFGNILMLARSDLWLMALLNLVVLVAAVLFVLGLRRLSRVRTARAGNLMAAVAMLIAVVGTLVELGRVDYRWMLAGGLVGAAVGTLAATRVPMTAMPELVALLNGGSGSLADLHAQLSPCYCVLSGTKRVGGH